MPAPNAAGPKSRSTSEAACRRLLWWTRAELDQIALHVGLAWRAWHENWVGPWEARAVRCELASEHLFLEARSWRSFAAAQTGQAWIEAQTEKVLGSLLFGSHAPMQQQPSLTDEVRSRAYDAAIKALRQVLNLQDAAPADEPKQSDVAAWSGAVAAALPLGSGEIQLLLSGPAVQALLPSRPNAPAPRAKPICALTVAIGSRQLTLAAQLHPFELNLGSLTALRVGDVIPLPHSLETPLLVKAGDALLCTAFLGQRQGQKAIEFATT